jgi:carbonic anhydrase/acetyltransferase-like protein (isoleucine patch superfamily)
MNRFFINQHQPDLADDAYVAPGAMVMGKVRMAEKSSIWFN